MGFVALSLQLFVNFYFKYRRRSIIMLRFQIALAIIFVGCIAFVSCGRMQDPLTPPVDDMMTDDDTSMETPMDMMMDMMKMGMHKSWAHVTLPAPVDTGEAHGTGARTVYFNEASAMANRAGTMYPAGTMIVKEIMDASNTFVMTVASMMKSEDPMYADHNGWMYFQKNRADAMADFMPQAGDGTERGSMGCHGCHAKAANDSVFVSLTRAAMADDGMGDDMMDDDMGDDMMDDDMGDDMMGDDMMDDDMGDDMMGDDMMGDDMGDDMADDMGDDMADDGMSDDMMDDHMGDDMTDDGMGDDMADDGTGNGAGNGEAQ